jgi:predicted enzyme related to lactoylglutathione lyase
MKLLFHLLVVVLIGASSRAAVSELPPLNEKSRGRLPGKFIWADLVTDDANAAMNFYGQVFNWNFKPFGNYVIVGNDMHPMGGIIQKARPANNSKARPRWFAYMSVSDVADAEAKVKNSGGKVLQSKTAFPKRGEQAIFADTEGAVFGVMKSKSGDPEDYAAGPGDWVWIQLLSRDAQKAGEFYRKIGGYDVVANTQPDRVNDYVLVSKGYARGTVRTLVSSHPDANPTWLLFVRVEDINKTLERAKLFQGTVIIEPKPDLFDGKVAVIADPTGAAVGLLQWSPQELAKGGK